MFESGMLASFSKTKTSFSTAFPEGVLDKRFWMEGDEKLNIF